MYEQVSAGDQKCCWFISDDRPQCGEPAETVVRIRGSIIQATLPVCGLHKKVHDERGASRRRSTRSKTPGVS